jgi:hypothetical protein
MISKVKTMSVLIEGVSVVILNSTIDKKYKGGLSKYKQDIPNGTLCTDGHIVRVGFMAPPDVGHFVMNLEKHGFIFKQNEKCVDIVVIDQIEGFTVPCDWLVFQRTPDGVAFCSLKGIEIGKIAVPNGWKLENSLSKKFTKVDNNNVIGRLQYLRTDGKVDVFLDKQTNKEVYMGRSSRENQGMICVADFLKKGVELVNPYIFGTNGKILNINSLEGRKDTDQGIEYLELVTHLDTQNWTAYWFLGKTYQTLSNNEKAFGYFKSAYKINPNHADICRELMMECLQLGKTDEGLSVAQSAVKLAPNDPGLLANLGLALFLNANLAEAKNVAKQSLALSPSDQITKNLLMMITQVQNGKRQQPRKISDLMKVG